MRDMISNIVTSHIVLDLDTVRSTYESIYDEMDLTDTERVNGSAIAQACREFLRSFEAKVPHDLLP